MLCVVLCRVRSTYTVRSTGMKESIVILVCMYLLSKIHGELHTCYVVIATSRYNMVLRKPMDLPFDKIPHSSLISTVWCDPPVINHQSPLIINSHHWVQGCSRLKFRMPPGSGCALCACLFFCRRRPMLSWFWSAETSPVN